MIKNNYPTIIFLAIAITLLILTFNSISILKDLKNYPTSEKQSSITAFTIYKGETTNETVKEIPYINVKIKAQELFNPILVIGIMLTAILIILVNLYSRILRREYE